MKRGDVYHNCARPDPRRPCYIERSLVWQKQRFKLRLVRLMPERLYVVAQDTDQGQAKLREGDILSRNLELTARNGFNPSEINDQNFQRFRNIYEAMRGLGRVRERHEAIDVPAADTWREGLQNILLMTADWRANGYDLPAELFEAMAGELAFGQSRLRDPEKIRARDQTVRLTLTDARGRHNPGRLPLRIFSAKEALRRRQNKARRINLKIDARVMVLADYFDQTISLIEETDWRVARLLRNPGIFGPRAQSSLMRKRACEIRDFADQLRRVHVRPFGPWALRHTAEDLEQAARFLNTGDQAAARVFLERIAGALRLVAARRQLERMLTIFSRAVWLKEPLSPEAFSQARLVIIRVRDQIRGLSAAEGFRNRGLLPSVLANLHTAMRLLSASKNQEERAVYKFLKSACQPI